eukprot:Gb_20595 [translate_table: standard]
MYIEAKHGKRTVETANTSKSERRKTQAKKGPSPPNKRKFSHTTQKGIQCEHCHVHGHKKGQCWKSHHELILKNKVGKRLLISHSTKVQGKEIQSTSYLDDKVFFMVKMNARNNTLRSNVKGRAKVDKTVGSTEKKDVCEAANKKLVNATREKLFHVKKQIKKTVVTAIFDSGSQKNFISKALIKQLGLKTIAHPEPYPLGWL